MFGGNNFNDFRSFSWESTYQISCRHAGMILLRKEVTVWFLAVQGSASMAYHLIPSHFKPWVPQLSTLTGLIVLCVRFVKKTEWWGAGMVICLEWGADLHTAQLMPLPLTVSCFSIIPIGFTFLVPTYPGNPGQRAVKRVCVCVCTWRWDGRQAGSPDQLVQSTGRAVRPRSGQLGVAADARRHVQRVWPRRLLGDARPLSARLHGRHVHVLLLALGEVQHRNAVPAVGIWRQPAGRRLGSYFHDRDQDLNFWFSDQNQGLGSGSWSCWRDPNFRSQESRVRLRSGHLSLKTD